MIDLEYFTAYSDMGVEKLKFIVDSLDLINTTDTLGIGLEIGTRLGGTAMLALTHHKIKCLISIDPYGDIPYKDYITNTEISLHFDEQMEMEAQININKTALELNKFFTHYKLKSLDFLRLNFDFCYKSIQYNINDLKYDYVLLDGEHNDYVVSNEYLQLKKRMNIGGIIVIDNIDWLNDLSFLANSNIVKQRQDMLTIKL